MTPSQFFTSAWSWNPWVMVVCGVTVYLGVARAPKRRPGMLHVRTPFFPGSPSVAAERGGWRSQLPGFWLMLGSVVLFLTLCSPINALANGYLFSAHMLQHLLLLLIVPLLILLGWPAGPVPRSFANGRLRWVNAILRRPLATWLLGMGGMWLWHAPLLCNAAVSSVWVRRWQSVSLLAMGLAFWWPILGPWIRQRLAPLPGMIYLFTACLGCTILGIIVTFSPVEVCSVYLHPVDRLGILPLIQDQWGLTPAKDQQLGGLLMWVPACLVYFFGILGLLARWYREPGQAAAGYAAAQPPLMEKPHGL